MSACGCGAPYQGRWLLKALLFLAAVLPTSGDCPKSCVCNVPTEVHCTFRYLTAVPDHIQPAVERINLGYNSISVLRENDLSGLENLELLMLHSNTIHSIYNRAFQDLKSLQVLKMSFNKVKEIKKETFKGLDNLLRIHMDHNNIEFISPEAFYGLNKLQLVHLEGNHLQQLHPDTFITLRHSQVFKVSSVRTIHLSENLLTTLPEEIFLGCSQLENLFLHGNPWTCDCRMKWFSVWAQRNTGVLKCKRDRRYPRGQLCPVCENPAPYHNTPLFLLSGDAFTCTKPWIQPHLKQKNISLDEGDFTPVSPKDFIAPLGSIQMNLTDHFHNDASLSCTVQRPSTFENLTQTLEEEEGNNATVLTAGIITYLVCNIDYEHIQQLWHILATYSDSPMTLERGFMLARRPEMVYRYSQIKTKEGEEGIYTNIVAEIKASPEWLMQGEVSFQLDRTTTTFSTLHIKYQSVINLRVENTSPKRGHYSWTMIKRDNQTKTEHTVLTGGVVQLDCQIWGEPKPLLEWILPDGNKVRGPYSSEDRRLIITAEGKLTLRGADASETGLYRCITTNYLDADILAFRVTVLSPDVEEAEVNGSTIISRQQIHIIPRKNSRGGGRRRTFQGRRRIIKPNRITDIQSFINKLQKPSLMKEGNATVPYRIELTTDCDWDEDKKKTAKKTATTDLQPVTPTVSSSSSLDRTERPASTQNTAASTTTYYITSNTAFIQTESRQEDRTPIVVSTDQTSKEENDLYEEFDWNTSSGLRAYTTTKTPLIYSTTFNPTTTFIPITTKGPYTTARTKVHSNIRPPAQRNSDHTTRGPPVRRIRPTAQISSARNSAGKGLHTVTIVSAVQRYTNTPAPYNNIGTQKAISSVYNHVAGNEATSANIAGFEPTANVKTSKPKIVGGIAASFTVLSNSDAFLPCEAVGNPQPAITWKRFHSNTGTTVTVKGRMGKFEVLSNGTLSIQNANIKDRGQYLCLAENDYGSDKLLVTLSVVTYPSRILEPTMRDIKSHAGNNVEMTCKAEGRPIPMISWILANQTQVRGQNTEKGRVSVSTDGTLVIEQVSVYDRGHYKCIASNPAGADTATVRLQVVAAPPGIVEEKRQQVKVGVSQNLWLPCTGQGSPQPTIHWVLHDGSTVRYNRPASDTRVSVYRNGTLHIKDVTQEDSGKYECIATSSTGSERMVVTLTVERQESAPQIMETSKRVTALFFEDQLRLSCSATGDPKPRIIWRLPSKAVVDQWHRMGSRIQVLDNGTLIIGLVSDKDAGDYLCVARNKIGDDLQLMKVSVSMKPAKIEPKLYGKKQVPYGKDFKVDCKASGAPKPEISWGLPDGTVVNSALQSDASSGGGRPRRYTLFDNGTLHLNQVGMSEEGDYTCYAENQVGKDEMHFHITVVTAAARIRPTSQTYVRVKPGGKIRFDCEALGEPKPKILWMLPTNDVIAASNERYLMHVNGSLDIRDVKLIDAGEYVCMARNPAGENRKVYKLDIEGNPPVINGYWQNRTVIKDVAAKYSRKFIDCKAEGDPMPSITWIMPDNIFLKAPYYGSRINVHHNGTLEIRNVRPTDTAEFICMARNDGGEAVMVVQLEVSSILRRPIFKNPFNERIVSRIGKTTVLNCSADGYPVPEITWTLPNGTRITSGHHLVRNGTLVIYDSGNEDAGKYRCGAKNFIGYIEKLIILDVGQKPYILTRPRGIIRSVSGEPLFLHCLSDGSPRPKIHWTIPSGHTLTRPQVLGRYQLLENGTLVVQDTTLHDRGNYICRARSDAGEAVLTVPVVIIAYPPRITLGPPPSVRSLTGTPIQLNCAAIGIPKPEITWELPNRSVLSAAEQGRPMGSELLHPQGTLIIQRPKASDSGTYKCLAKNLLGTDSKITYVHIF
ncbi:hypothetical protein VZT92_020819 [Zoarces viviparus]|uniref:Ig-like domain-containing protein n=1 Tax=Zoarces viviparus TaxID=48416 RepID=A0AAW1EFD4_ZOAVI